MNTVHPHSQECLKTELNLFSVPPTQLSLDNGRWIDHKPVSSTRDGGAITFMYTGTEKYGDLSKTLVVVRAKVTKADGIDLDQNKKVCVVNNLLHSVFKQVDVYFKERQVSQAMGTYPYRAYLETLLNYGPSAKRSQLTSAFYKDTAGKIDVANPVAGVSNQRIKARYMF